MITCRVFHDGTKKEGVPFDREVIEAAREGKGRVWLDVVDPSDDELERLQSEPHLHELAIEDSKKRDWL